MKTAELTGAALDWAVAKCEGVEVLVIERQIVHPEDYEPSTKWAIGGPIIEREKIGVTPITVTVGDDRGKRHWFANHEDKTDFQDGPTPLIAAMRCYVASKLGAEVELPKELQP